MIVPQGPQARAVPMACLSWPRMFALSYRSRDQTLPSGRPGRRVLISAEDIAEDFPAISIDSEALNARPLVRLDRHRVLGGGSLPELGELLLIAADPERGDDLHHPGDDQPDADHQCQGDQRIERIAQHDDAGEDCDTPKKIDHPR